MLGRSFLGKGVLPEVLSNIDDLHADLNNAPKLCIFCSHSAAPKRKVEDAAIESRNATVRPALYGS